MGFSEEETPIARWLSEPDTGGPKMIHYDPTDEVEGKGVSVIWKNLSITADIQKSHVFGPTEHVYKKLIHNINGIIHPGRFVAVLGSSGSGKSTLMSVLANRNPSALLVDGDIRIGGKKMGKFTRQMTGFVYQDDLFIAHLTVKEHLNFSARLRLSRTINDKEISELVMNILTEVGLLKCANNRIGFSDVRNNKTTLSGGERKRLSVATELLTNPSLLFCDEPTTGLDSFTALKLMSLMRSLSIEKEKTIICSIHQPSESIFLLFDQIVLLSGGKVAFMGCTDDAISFFQSQGYPYPSEKNPAEYLIQVVASAPGKEALRIKEVTQLCRKFSDSEYGQEIIYSIDKEIVKCQSLESFSYDKKVYVPPSFVYKLFIITFRNFLGILRNPSIQMTRFIQKLIVGLLIGLCMQGSVNNNQRGIQALCGVIFVMTAQNFFPAIYAIMNHVPKQLPVFYREYGSGMSSPLIFILSDVFSLFPVLTMEPILFTSIVYWFVYLQPTWPAYILTCFISALVFHTSTAFGVLLSVLFRNIQFAFIISSPLESALSVLSGFFIKLSTIPWIIMWLKFISWFTYGCETIFIIQMQGVHDIECDPNPSLPCLRNGTEVLTRYDFKASDLWPNIIKMLTIYFAFYIIAYFLLLNRIRKRTI